MAIVWESKKLKILIATDLINSVREKFHSQAAPIPISNCIDKFVIGHIANYYKLSSSVEFLRCRRP